MRLLPILPLLFALPAAAGPIYKWTDEWGRTHFSDRLPPEGVAGERVRLPDDSRSMPGRDASATAVSGSAPPSARLRERRCMDFSGALVQLDQIAEIEDRDDQWQEAYRIARNGVRKWCE